MAANNKNSSNTKKTASRSNASGKAKASKSTGKKTTSARRSGAGSKRKQNTSLEVNPYQDEIIVIAALVVSILFALSTFNLCGVFGEYVGSFLFGVFGVLAYLLPYFLFLVVAFSISNRGNRSIQIKIGCCVGVYVVAIALTHMITNGYEEGADILAFYTESAAEKSGGGILGGAIGTGLASIFGEPGTYVILIGAGIGLLILITERLLFASVREKSIRSKEIYDARREEQRAEREAYREQRTLEAAERPKARVFTFSQADKDEMLNAPFKIFGTEAVEAKETVAESINGMKEIVPSDNMDNLSISRGVSDVIEEMTITKETVTVDDERAYTNIPVYQEELNQKFKHSTEVQDDLPEVTEEMKSEADHFFEKVEKEMQEEKATVEKVDTKEEVAKVEEEIKKSATVEKPKHVFPPMDLLSRPKGDGKSMSDQDLKNTAMKLQSTLESFGVRVEMKNVSCGPTVTRYELQPAQGVKVSKITSLTDDIKLSLAAADIRIEAPIPGKSAVGIEVPNTHNSMVYLRTLLESPEFKEHKSNIAIAVGKDIGGKTIVTDIAKMPHLLIAGATGSGKSVFINTLIMSILYKAHPDDVKLIMVDPKVVELSVYNGIPHLLIPVVTDPKKASGALNWAVMEMTERYKKFADLGVRDLKGYNEKVAVVEDSGDERFKKMPQIVIIVDELADLMMVAPGEVEDAICRLAQLARACGIHLVIATQRPSVNVITGVIKANIPSRVAFAVSSAIDSRTILDGSGAEKLLGNGDMLFFPSGFPKPIRVQGSYVSDKEVGEVVQFLTEQNGTVEYNEEVTNKITTAVTSDSGQVSGNERDEHFVEAGRFVIERDKASIGVLQRVFKVGYNRAARIMDQLYDAGVVGPEEGTKPRKVIMSMEQFEEYIDEYV